MVVQVHKSGDTFSFQLPPEAAKELNLEDGTAIEIRIPESTPEIRAMSVEEALAAHRRTDPEYREVYAELAK